MNNVQKKILPNLKTNPYLTTKQSGENVANQERNGATTEEVNQVSPSTQYEGAVTYTQFGEGQEGTIYYEDGVAKIKDLKEDHSCSKCVYLDEEYDSPYEFCAASNEQQKNCFENDLHYEEVEE